MDERRKSERLKTGNDVVINIVSEDDAWLQEKIPSNSSRDISVSGAKIQGNILLPVDTILKIDITLKKLHQKITTVGKVRWNRVLLEDTCYEAGVEFIDTPDEAIQRLYEREQTLKEEWAGPREGNSYEIRQEGDSFIPIEEWSSPQAIEIKEKAPAAEQTMRTPEKAGRDTKNCRYCSREIKSDSVKCEYCGRTLTERTNKKIFV